MTFKDNAAINFNIFQHKKCSFVSNMTGHTVVVTACNCYEDIQKTVVKAVWVGMSASPPYAFLTEVRTNVDTVTKNIPTPA
jgi:hypothetical protein